MHNREQNCEAKTYEANTSQSFRQCLKTPQWFNNSIIIPLRSSKKRNPRWPSKQFNTTNTMHAKRWQQITQSKYDANNKTWAGYYPLFQPRQITVTTPLFPMLPVATEHWNSILFGVFVFCSHSMPTVLWPLGCRHFVNKWLLFTYIQSLLCGKVGHFINAVLYGLGRQILKTCRIPNAIWNWRGVFETRVN